MDEATANDIWEKSLYPGVVNGGYSNLMYEELSGFLDIPVSEIKSIGQESQQLLNEEWDEKSHGRPVDFYKSNVTYLYNLTNWHANYGESYARVKVMRFFKDRGVRRVLDYGSGIGSTAVLFASNGLDVTAADVAIKLLSYLKYRIDNRGLECSIIDLNSDNLPQGCYGAVTAIDVLEHIDNLKEVLKNIYNSLEDGGFFCFNVCGSDGAPMHISEAEQVLRHMKLIGFEKNKNHNIPLFIYQKKTKNIYTYMLGLVLFVFYNIRHCLRLLLVKIGVYSKVRDNIKLLLGKLRYIKSLMQNILFF